MLAVSMSILTGIDGWLMFETTGEVAVDVGARIAIALCVGMLAGGVVTVMALPYVLWHHGRLVERCQRVVLVASKIMILVSSCAVLGVFLRWVMAVGLLNLTNHEYIELWFCVSCVLFVATIVRGIFSPRKTVPSSELINRISGRATRRLLLIAGVGGLLTAFSNNWLPKPEKRRLRITKTRNSTPNIVLVTFDALSAEDVSCYGRALPTTPNIDRLAARSSVFSNYYSASTFTTPSVVAMLTGRYPSNTHVYHYGGSLQGSDIDKNLANVLRAGGYTTAASVANPGAHPDCLGFGDDFDVLPSPPIRDFAMREVTARFHSASLSADVGFAGRTAPYLLEQLSPELFGRTHSIFPPKMSFDQASQMLVGLKDPFFLWVHTYAPHFPYLPDPPFLKEFLQTDELRTHRDFANLFDLKGYNYSPGKQVLVDKARLRYDEWVAQADDAFGQFMTALGSAGHLDETAIVVSSDHGESFSGGFVGHGGPRQLRPIVHVPLIVHLPGQETGQRVGTVADQTRLAPTLLDIAGIMRPDWMDGQSLLDAIRGEDAHETHLAFTEYLETNNAFKPIRHGTVGVLDGVHQYVFNLDTKTGTLYTLGDAHTEQTDVSALHPELVTRMRGEIARRFPGLVGA